MNKKFRSVLFAVTCCTFFLLPVQNSHAADTHLSQELFLSFLEAGFHPDIQFLESTYSSNFPFNILFSYQRNNTTAGTDETHLLIALSQTDVLQTFDSFCAFLSLLEQFPPSDNITVLCSAADTSRLPADEPQKTPTGIETFLLHNTTSAPSAAIVLNTIKSSLFDSVQITPGGAGTVSPFPLAKYCFSALSDAHIPYTVTGKSMSLYRLGIIRTDPKLSFLLQSDIPAIGISIIPQKNANVFFTMLSTVLHEQSAAFHEETWDRQYSITSIPFFNHQFYFSELFFIQLLLILSGLALVSISFFPFASQKTGKRRLQDLKKTWYFLPLFVIINVLILFIAQKTVTGIFSSWKVLPEAAFLFKLLLAVSLFLFVSFSQYLFNLPVSFFIYGYLLTITAFINIFIFAALDISLIPYFAAEYVIVYLSRSFKRTVPLCIALLLMGVPFIPFIYTLSQNTSPDMLQKLTDCDPGINILIACFFIPFQIMWIRILVRLGLFGKQRNSEKKQIAFECALAAATVITLAAGLVYLRKNIDDSELRTADHLQSEATALSVSVSGKKVFFRDEITCTITSALPAVKYRVEVSSDTYFPVTGANRPYAVHEKLRTAVFSFAEFPETAVPPDPIELVFSIPAASEPNITVTGWLQDDSGSIKKEIITAETGTEKKHHE